MLRQDNCKFEASLGYTVRFYHKNKARENEREEGRKEGKTDLGDGALLQG